MNNTPRRLRIEEAIVMTIYGQAIIDAAVFISASQVFGRRDEIRQELDDSVLIDIYSLGDIYMIHVEAHGWVHKSDPGSWLRLGGYK